jgi:ubiquinone/menaquinone biosynthesis C-methylase UbiE
MSSPIANNKPSLIQKKLIDLHQRTTHSKRIIRLSDEIVKTIGHLFPSDSTSIRALDVGCGDMTLAENIATSIPSVSWMCTDIHELPAHLTMSKKWKKYRRFDGISLPFKDKTFDVVLLSDVLHHCLSQSVALLKEAGRVGRFVVVKDHYEDGFYSRQILRVMDFVGNYGYGVEVPSHYFTHASFALTCKEANLKIKLMRNDIDLYSDIPISSLLIRKCWQFIAILEKE